MFATSIKAKIFAATLIIAGAGGPTFAIAGDSISVNIHMARVLRLDSPASTVIVGNPGIADITIQDPQTLVLTGKSYGRTNLIALDSAGNPIADTAIVVRRGVANIVTVYFGSSRTSVACAPECQPTIQIGDDTAYTEDVIKSSSLVADNAN